MRGGDAKKKKTERGEDQDFRSMLRDVQKFGELAMAFCLFTSPVSFGELRRQEWYGFCVYVFQCTKYHLSLSQLPQL